MIVSIHQPNYLPWLGFFSKIKHSDCYVVLDNVAFSKNSVTNRNKIRTKEGWSYLTIPIARRFYGSKICDVRLPENSKWQLDHWKTIETYYKKAEHFSNYKDFFEQLYASKLDYLVQINEKAIFYLFECFIIKAEIREASKFVLEPGLYHTDLRISILK